MCAEEVVLPTLFTLLTAPWLEAWFAESQPRPAGVSVVRQSSLQSDVCSWCRNDLEANDVVFAFVPCGHQVHSECAELALGSALRDATPLQERSFGVAPRPRYGAKVFRKTERPHAERRVEHGEPLELQKGTISRTLLAFELLQGRVGPRRHRQHRPRLVRGQNAA